MSTSLFIKAGNLYHRVEVEDILFLQSNGNYTYVTTPGKNYVVKTSLTSLHGRINRPEFIQVHKRYVVNSHRVDALDIKKSHLLVEQHEIPIGRSFKADFFDQLDLFN